jgi:hypothetical protein
MTSALRPAYPDVCLLEDLPVTALEKDELGQSVIEQEIECRRFDDDAPLLRDRHGGRIRRAKTYTLSRPCHICDVTGVVWQALRRGAGAPLGRLFPFSSWNPRYVTDDFLARFSIRLRLGRGTKLACVRLGRIAMR